MKHLFKSILLLLVSILLPGSISAHKSHSESISTGQQRINQLGSTHFLSGDVSIQMDRGDYPGTNCFNIHISYSGSEDVSMTILIDNKLLDSIHSNLWSIQNYFSNQYNHHILEVIVNASGYFPLHAYKYFQDYSSSYVQYTLLNMHDGGTGDGSVFSYTHSETCYCSVNDNGFIYHTNIWQFGFREFTGDITIPQGVSIIGNYAFNVLEGLHWYGYYNPPVDNRESVYFPIMQSHQAVLFVPCTITAIERNAFGNETYQSDGVPYTFSNVNIENLASWCAIDFKGNKCNPLIYSSGICIKGVKINDLVIPNTIPALRSYAFAGCPGVNTVILPVSTIYGRQVFLGSSVQSLMLTGEGSFQDGSLDMTASTVYIDAGVNKIEGIKVKPTDVYCYSNTPPTCDENSFTDYSGTLHVPAAALAAYFTAPHWSNFINIVGDVNEPKSVSISHNVLSLLPGISYQLAASMDPTDATGLIVWNSTNNNVASVENGHVTAIAPGECDIIANCVGKQAICHVTVTEIKPTSITLNQENALMETGTQLALSATVLPDSTTNKTVEWSSSDANIATVDNGVVTAVHSGECEIIARCQNVQAVCHVAVSGVLPTAITLSQEEALIKQDTQLTLTVSILPDSTTFKTVSWLSTDTLVATVTDGIVTAIGSGECDIIAQCHNLQAICHLTVVQFTLNQHEAQLLPNHMLTLTPAISSIFTNLQVTSSDPAVAAARLAGDKIQVVGITEGATTICVNSADGYAFSDSCLVEVYTERGDVNCDGFVNISDVTVLIDALLSSDIAYSVENSDCNNDGNVTISDVTALIDALLGGATLPGKDSEIITVNGVSFKMMKVKGGTFLMGATDGQGDQAYDDEHPVHEVTLSSYSIGETEVTQALWQAVMYSNPSGLTGNLNRPVETVSWNDCQTFIAKLNQMTGKSFRLPTEAEWEFAARGGNLSHDYMYTGSNNMDEVAWVISNIPSQQPNTEGYGTQPVAQKAPNELGLFDMSGNVYEWCSDWFDAYPAEPQVNPTGPGDDEGCHYRVNRGGSWNRYGRSSRVSLRNNATPESAYFNIGLRLAM